MSNYIERYWRDATPEDAIKEPPMVARFKTDSIWAIDQIIGFRKSEIYKWLWYNSKGGFSTCCQVYDAPNPGEGWRLIDTASEKPQDGDEIYDPSTRQWTKRLSPFTPNVLSINRRRITPAVTCVPFTWEDREQLRGRWIIDEYDNEYQVTRFELHATFGLCIEGAGPQELLEKWKFLDTGKPVGKEVTQ